MGKPFHPGEANGFSGRDRLLGILPKPQLGFHMRRMQFRWQNHGQTFLVLSTR